MMFTSTHESRASRIAPVDRVCTSPSCVSRCVLPFMDTRMELGITVSEQCVPTHSMIDNKSTAREKQLLWFLQRKCLPLLDLLERNWESPYYQWDTEVVTITSQSLSNYNSAYSVWRPNLQREEGVWQLITLINVIPLTFCKCILEWLIMYSLILIIMSLMYECTRSINLSL